jgi:hypothetical protein
MKQLSPAKVKRGRKLVAELTQICRNEPSFKSALSAKYKIQAKDHVKMELEALADLMKDKDQYVIFTKTPKI